MFTWAPRPESRPYHAKRIADRGEALTLTSPGPALHVRILRPVVQIKRNQTNQTVP